MQRAAESEQKKLESARAREQKRLDTARAREADKAQKAAKKVQEGQARRKKDGVQCNSTAVSTRPAQKLTQKKVRLRYFTKNGSSVASDTLNPYLFTQ